MIEKIFSFKGMGSKPDQKSSNKTLSLSEIKDLLDTAQEDDPLIHVKAGAHDFLVQFMESFRDEKGIDLPKISTILGALAGISCAQAARTIARDSDHPEPVSKEDLASLLHPLVWDSPVSLLQTSCVALMNKSLERERIEQAKTTAKNAQDLSPPSPSLTRTAFEIWPTLLAVLQESCAHPVQWPTFMGLMLQELIFEGKTIAPPDETLKIMMKSAMPFAYTTTG